MSHINAIHEDLLLQNIPRVARPPPLPSPPQHQPAPLTTNNAQNTAQCVPQAPRKKSCFQFSAFTQQYSTKARLTALGLALGLLSLITAVIALAPGFKSAESGDLSVKYALESIALDAWQANATFRAWCQDEQSVVKPLSAECQDILEKPLPPPPPFPPPPTHARRASKGNLQKALRLHWFSTQWSHQHVFSTFFILVLCLWGFSRRWPGRHFRWITRPRRAHGLLPIFCCRRYGHIVYDSGITIPQELPPVPRPIATISSPPQGASSTGFSFALSPTDTGMTKRLSLPKPQPIVRKPLPPLMEEFLAKFEKSRSQQTDALTQARTARSEHSSLVKNSTQGRLFDLHLNQKFSGNYRHSEQAKVRFQTAALKGNIAELKEMVCLGYPINMTMYQGWTALHTAAAEGHFHLVNYLLNVKALIDVPNWDGQTALHLALQGGHQLTVRLLVRRGADRFVIDKYGASPRVYAKRAGLEETLDDLDYREVKLRLQ